MFDELEGEALIGVIFFGQFQSNVHQVKAEHAHPAGCIRLFQHRTARQLLAAVEGSDIVEAEKASLKDVVPGAINLIDPPGKVDQQLVKALFQELSVSSPSACLFHV